MLFSKLKAKISEQPFKLQTSLNQKSETETSKQTLKKSGFTHPTTPFLTVRASDSLSFVPKKHTPFKSFLALKSPIHNSPSKNRHPQIFSLRKPISNESHKYFELSKNQHKSKLAEPILTTFQTENLNDSISLHPFEVPSSSQSEIDNSSNFRNTILEEIKNKFLEKPVEQININSISVNKYCLNHPIKLSEFSCQIDTIFAGFCATCAVKYASQNIQVNELHLKNNQKPRPARRELIDSFLSKIDRSKTHFTNKKNEIRTQKSVLQKLVAKKKEVLERIFISLIDTLEKRKYLWDENLTQENLSEKQVADKHLEEIDSALKCVDKIKTDILENYQTIIDETGFQNFDAIFEHHQNLFEEKTAGVNKVDFQSQEAFTAINVKQIVDNIELFLEKQLTDNFIARLPTQNKPLFNVESLQNFPLNKLSCQPLIKKINSMHDYFSSSKAKLLPRIESWKKNKGSNEMFLKR